MGGVMPRLGDPGCTPGHGCLGAPGPSYASTSIGMGQLWGGGPGDPRQGGGGLSCPWRMSVPSPSAEGCPQAAMTRGAAGSSGHSLTAQTQKCTWQLLKHGVALPWHREDEGVGWQRPPPQLPPHATNPGHEAEHPALRRVPNTPATTWDKGLRQVPAAEGN